ncbi:hypothetical protein GCM10027592_63350 [Spirosoma flavus]
MFDISQFEAGVLVGAVTSAACFLLGWFFPNPRLTKFQAEAEVNLARQEKEILEMQAAIEANNNRARKRLGQSIAERNRHDLAENIRRVRGSDEDNQMINCLID